MSINMVLQENAAYACPVCAAPAALLDVVDLNKSCLEERGSFLPLAGVPVYYALCESCNFCFAPTLHGWTLDDFATVIYNDAYLQVDPDYLEARPRHHAEHLISLLGNECSGIRHLDYGGGHGLLSDLLRDAKWDSVSYDPFVDRGKHLADLGKFDLITAYEVFEHVPDVRKLAADLALIVRDEGVILFSTSLSDGHIKPRQRLTWWYASPRNGHISLFSETSLGLLAQREGFNFGSFSPNYHAFWKTVPRWARHFLKAP